MLKKKEKKITPIKNPKNYIVFCIWGDGPGRPYDNAYILVKKEMDEVNNILRLYFEGNKECIIENPSEIIWKEKGLKISKADRVFWKSYYYGEPPTEDNIGTYEYILLDKSHVHIVAKGRNFSRDEIINIEKEIAINSF